MKVLLVTGKLAETIVRRHARESRVETSVVALPVPVASLLTPELIAHQLCTMNLKGYDMILVPGLVRGNLEVVEKKCKVTTFKGPRYSADIPFVLNALEEVFLSKIEPADNVLRQAFAEQAHLQLEKAENLELLGRPGTFLIGDVPIGRGFPMRIIAEILDAPMLSDNEIRSRARYYVESGANIIDIGMMAGNPKPREADRAVKAVKSLAFAPVAIDTIDVEEAKMAVDAGADLLLSLDVSTMVEAASFARDIGVVILPTDSQRGYSPKESQARAEALRRNVSYAKELGYRKIIADPVADPLITPGLLDSTACYQIFSRQHPDIPLLFGAGNVTELLDADSVGANALLAGIAAEVNASFLLTTEGSNKTLGAIRELSIASEMMFLAKKRSSVPKDLGLDLLILKEKRRLDEPNEGQFDEKRVIKARPVPEEAIDEAGSYRIMVDRSKKQIIAIRYKENIQEEILVGSDATSIYDTLIKMGLVTRMDHSAYLGRELTKAEIALKLGRSYVQDNPLFLER
jgi:dihydropteroate synthase-like protein